MSDFSKNLRLLCARESSVSAICREIGFNRQQFGKYLDGSTLPSAHNLRRICMYFHIDDRELFEPHADFRKSHRFEVGDSQGQPWKVLAQAFPGNLRALRRYLGMYHAHYVSPSWPQQIMRSMTLIYEDDGFVLTRTSERAVDAKQGIRQRSRYSGLVSHRNNRIFVVEKENLSKDSIVETVLSPARRLQPSYLRGMTIGLSWRPDNQPFTSRTIWKKLRANTDIRDAVSRCGAFSLESNDLDPVVRNFFGDAPPA